MASSCALSSQLKGLTGFGPCSSRVKASRRCTVLVKANEDGKRVDWDKEWNRYSQRRGGIGGASSNVRTSNRIPVDPAAKMTRDRIRKEESFLLNAWSSNVFQGAGVAVAVIVLLAILLAAGPPPADSRCTLPWC